MTQEKLDKEVAYAREQGRRRGRLETLYELGMEGDLKPEALRKALIKVLQVRLMNEIKQDALVTVEEGAKDVWIITNDIRRFLEDGPLKNVFEANLRDGTNYVIFTYNGLDAARRLILTRNVRELKKSSTFQRYSEQIRIIELPEAPIVLTSTTMVIDPFDEGHMLALGTNDGMAYCVMPQVEKIQQGLAKEILKKDE